MLSGFERKVRQIIQNDRITRRVTSLADLSQRTGHDTEEIREVVEKLKQMPQHKGGLKD